MEQAKSLCDEIDMGHSAGETTVLLSVPISLAVKGYDLAKHLDEELQAFIRGAKCEQGFKVGAQGAFGAITE